MKVDVAVQSYNKPESLIYTLFTLKKYCEDFIDTIYINDDCSKDGTIDFYVDKEFIKRMYPIKIKVRINGVPSGYTKTLLTKKMWKRKKNIEKIHLLLQFFMNRVKFFKNENDIRYQWAINETDKKYLFIIHDDIKFFDNVIKLYLQEFDNDPKMIIVGDLGGSKRCPFGPCLNGNNCNPQKILNGCYPTKNYPITGEKSFFHTLIGRHNRNCRINEWCCMIDVRKTRDVFEKSGIYFGNYEGGGDVATYWFEYIFKNGYSFTDPLPTKKQRLAYYLHWWQGYEGHSVWVDSKTQYENSLVRQALELDFNYKLSDSLK